MTNRLLLILHLLGASLWIGGHFVLLAVILPAARRARDPRAVLEFERNFGKWGMLALVTQISTGALLASPWIGGWGSVLSTSTPARPLVFTKLALLAVILVFAAHASRRLLPRLTPDTLGRFVIHAWIVTVLSVALLVFGIGVRMGGLY